MQCPDLSSGHFSLYANREFHYNRGRIRKGREPCPKQTARWAPRRSASWFCSLPYRPCWHSLSIFYTAWSIACTSATLQSAGDAALAGVGVCAPVVTMITAIGALIGFGGGPLMSIRMGRRDMDGARQIITNSFYLLLALSVLATVPLLMFQAADPVHLRVQRARCGITRRRTLRPMFPGTVFALTELTDSIRLR